MLLVHWSSQEEQYCSKDAGEDTSLESECTKKQEEAKEEYLKIKWTNDADFQIREELDEGDSIIAETPEDAAEVFEEILTRFPSSQRARYSLAKTYQVLSWRTNDTREKEDFLNNSVKNIKLLTEVSNLNENIAQATSSLYLQLAENEFKRKDHGLVLSALKFIVKINPGEAELNYYALETYMGGDMPECEKAVDLILEKFSLAPMLITLLKADMLKRRGLKKEANKMLRDVDVDEILEKLPRREAQETMAKCILDLNYLGAELDRRGRLEELDSLLKDASRLHIIPSKFQRVLDYIPRLKAQPVWNIDSLRPANRWNSAQSLVAPNLTASQLNTIHKQLSTIQTEAGVLLEDMSPDNGWAKDTDSLVKNGALHSQDLYVWGKKRHSTCGSAPKLCKMLKKWPDASKCKKCKTKLVVLDPQTDLLAHVGPSNSRLRSIIPLEVPGGAVAGIEVAGVKNIFKQGEMLIIDDSFQKRIWNHHVSDKLVLLSIDFHHLDLKKKEKEGKDFSEYTKHRFSMF